MGIVSAIVAVAKFVAGIGAVAKFVAGTILSIGVSRLMAKRAMKKANAGGDGGARIQLPPATDNKLPIIYGSAYVSGPVIDAKISTDQKTMWYVVALAEHSDDQGGGGGSYTFDTTNIYYDGKKVNFVGSSASVASLQVNNEGTTQIDTRVNGKLFIYLFTNGSSSGVNTGGQTAIQILSDAQIPFAQRWTANHLMSNTCFAIVKVIYNTDAGTTSLGAIACKISNSLTKPGECIKDYLLNTRYGCAIPIARIDTDSLDDLDTYSDQTIEYIPADGDTTPPLPTQERYRINGPLDTANDCLTNLQILVDACDSWLQYSELSGKWKVVINKPYDVAPNAETTNDLFLVDSSNLVGGITLNPIDLNETYNEVEVAYPNSNIKDQTDFQVLQLEDYQATLLSPNEAVNRLNVQLPVVNNAVQAKYLAVRRLLQSREDLVIVFRTDYSGIQVLAGDVIRVTHPVYGWTEKLFRVSNVSEEKYGDGTLGAQLVAFEYNSTIYADNSIQDYIPAFNTGLTDPNIISEPGTPIVTTNPDTTGVVTSFNVVSAVPEQGSVLYMDFNYGLTSNVETHVLYRTVQAAGGIPFTNSEDIANNINVTNLNIDINDLPANLYYFSTTARNDFAGRVSNVSNSFVWPGAGVNEANVIDANGVYSNGNILTSNNAIANLAVGANVYLVSGNGILANNTVITVINSTTPTANFEVDPTPLTALDNATIQVVTAGIPGNAIVPNTMPGNRVTPNSLNGNTLIAATANGNIIINGTITNVQIANDTIISNNIAANAIVAGKIDANAVTANTIAANAITAGKIDANAVTANTIAANAITAGKIDANAVTAGTIAANAVTAGTVAANAITAGTIAANAVTATTVAANAITAGTIAANAVTVGTIAANAVTSGTIAANAVTANTIAANAITAGTIAANAVTAGTIDANAVTSGTVAANAITAGTIAANAVTAGTIDANAVTSNTIAANSITSDKIAANSITSVMIQANTVTTEQLVIGSVTQARSSIQEAQVQPVPFTNISNAWPDNTRSIVPAGGVTIIPTTDPNTSANIEYQEGSRIQVGFTVKLYTNPTGNANTDSNYNLIELWKSGASDQFDKGLNTVRRSYEDNTYGRTQTIHAYGFGSLDLYSDDQGNTWATFSNVAAGNAIMTGATNYATGGNLANIQTFNVGPLQDVDNNGTTFCAGSRAGNTGSGSKLDLDENLPILASTNLKLDMNGLEYAPGTGIDAGAGSNREILGVADNGTIFWSPTGTFTTTAQTTEGVSGLYKNLYGIYAGAANGTAYTAVAVGQTGTILRSDRTLNTAGTWSSKDTQIIGNTELLTDLYGVASDNTVPSATSKWVAVGQYGMIQVSIDDGDEWEQIESPVVTNLNGVRYGNGVWVAVGDSGVILKNSGNIQLANNWIQVDTSNLDYANGSNYGSIEDRDLRTIDYSETYNKFFIGGTGMIVRATANTTIVPEVSYQVAASETYDLTRMTYFGSWANVQQITQPPAEQRVLNNQVFSYSLIDTDYVQGQETTYYLVVGNMNGATVYVGQAYLNVQEIKR